MLETIFYPMFAAVIYSISQYLKKSEKQVPDNERFSINKLVATAIYGMFIGLVAYLTGVEVTEQYMLEQSAAYGFVAVMVQNGVSYIFRWASNKGFLTLDI